MPEIQNLRDPVPCLRLWGIMGPRNPMLVCWSAGLDDKENEVEATSELGDSLFLGKPQWELL